MKKLPWFEMWICLVAGASIIAAIHQPGAAQEPQAADVRLSAEYRMCIDQTISATSSDRMFAPAVRGMPGSSYYSDAASELQVFIHGKCMPQFEGWMHDSCMGVVGVKPQACLKQDLNLMIDEAHQLGYALLTAYYPDALGSALLMKKMP